MSLRIFDQQGNILLSCNVSAYLLQDGLRSYLNTHWPNWSHCEYKTSGHSGTIYQF